MFCDRESVSQHILKNTMAPSSATPGIHRRGYSFKTCRQFVFNSFVLDALAASSAAELYRSHSSNTDMKSCHNSNAPSSSAPFVAAERDPRHTDSDTLSPNSFFDGPQASKFKKRGRKAGKARDATANCSSACTNTS